MYKNNYVNDINAKLIERRFPDDIQTTLNIPEHKFKKISDKFNYALKEVYDAYEERDVKMFHILLSLQEYFDMKWLVDNIINEDNKIIIETELSSEFNLKKSE